MVKKHYPTIKQTIYLLIIYIIVTLLTFFLLAMIAIALRLIDLNNIAGLLKKYPQILGIINFLSIGFLVTWGYKKSHTPLRQLFPLRLVPLSVFVPITLILIGLHFLLSDIDNILRMILNTPPDPNNIVNRLINGNSIWNTIMVLVIIAPFTEEFLFRGIILTGFLNNYTIKKALWISALFFAIFHFNLFQFPSAFIGGLFFAWLVIKTKSLWPSIFGHALTNGLPIIICQFLKLSIPGYSMNINNHISMQPIWLDGVGLGFLGLGIWLLWPMLHEKLEKPSELLRNQIEVEPLLATDGSTEIPTVLTSKQGLASLIIGITIIIFLVTTVGIVLYYRTILYVQLPQIATFFIGLLAITGFLGSFIGFGFGVAGIIKKSKFTIPGIILNGLYLLLGIYATISIALKR